jgi:hypothetical protein
MMDRLERLIISITLSKPVSIINMSSEVSFLWRSLLILSADLIIFKDAID